MALYSPSEAAAFTNKAVILETYLSNIQSSLSYVAESLSTRAAES